MNDAYTALVDALAEQLVRDYLAPEAAPGNDSDAERTERVLLPDMGRAA